MVGKSWTWMDEARFRLIQAGILTGTATSMVLMPLINAFVLMMIWRWYVSSYFSIPSLDMVHAFGLTLIVNLLRKPESPEESQAKAEQAKHPFMAAIIMGIVGPLSILLMGWIGSFWL